MSLTADQHHYDGEDLLRFCVGRHVAKAHRRQTGERVVQCGHIRVHVAYIVRMRQFQSFGQCVHPT